MITNCSSSTVSIALVYSHVPEGIAVRSTCVILFGSMTTICQPHKLAAFDEILQYSFAYMYCCCTVG
jgi:hypothetical protein